MTPEVGSGRSRTAGPASGRGYRAIPEWPGRQHGRRLTRRGLLAAAAGAGAACALPWQRPDSAARVVVVPTATAGSVGPARLRFVLAPEGLPPLDAAIQAAVERAGRDTGVTVEIESPAGFVPAGGSLAHRLLVAVQAGVPPDGVLLLGRQAQTVRFQAMGLLHDVSGLMRAVHRRFGASPEATERQHRVAGSWFALPLYQRLVGHWLGLPPGDPAATGAGLDQETFPSLRDTLTRAARPDDGTWGWGIGGADTPDVDAWCWGVIHAWGGALADGKGERVTLQSAQTVEALAWLRSTLSEAPWRDAVHPAAAAWADPQKNAAVVAGAAAYTFTDRLLAAPAGNAGGQTGGAPAAAPTPALWGNRQWLRAPGGPAAPPGQLRAIGGGAAWLLPRGAPAERVERLWEALLDPAAQRGLWAAGGGLVLPAYAAGWDDPGAGSLPGGGNIERFRRQLAAGGRHSTAALAGPETAAAQAAADGRLAAGMLRAVLRGRLAPEVVEEAGRQAVALFRDFGLPGA